MRYARENARSAAAEDAWMAGLGCLRLSSAIASSFDRCVSVSGTRLSAMHSSSLGLKQIHGSDAD